MKHERFYKTLLSINLLTKNLKYPQKEYLNFKHKNKIKLLAGGLQESVDAFEYLIMQNGKFLDFLNSSNLSMNFQDFFNVNLWTDITMNDLNNLYLKFIEKDGNNQNKLLTQKESEKILDISNSQSKYKKQGKNQDEEDDEGEYNYPIIKICRNEYCDKFKDQNNEENDYIW